VNQGETYLLPAQLKHLVITGGAGFIGFPLAGELLYHGMKVTVIYEKFHPDLGFQTRFLPDDGIRKVLRTTRTGLIGNPNDQRYRTAQFIVQ
jgi:hypothetical protein